MAATGFDNVGGDPGSLGRVRPLGVRAQGWGWQHPGRSQPAVTSLELDVEPGEKVLLLGASGSGKSTFLHAAAGVLGQQVGARQWGALEVYGGGTDRAPGRVALMQQDPQSQVVLSRVGDDVAFGLENQGVPADRIWPRVRQALEQVGLRVPLHHGTHELSGGQKQRLGLAGMVAMRPGLWLLDEPTANIDPAGVLQVRDTVARILAQTGATLIVVEHRVEAWLPVVDRVVILGGGEVLADGPAERVLREAGASLRACGIWLPGWVPQTTPRRSPGSGQLLLEATGMAVSHVRPPVRKRSRARRAREAAATCTVAAKNIDICVQEGAAVAVTGPNGAGKSALALTVGGLLPPVAGILRAADGLSRGAGQQPLAWSGFTLIERIGTVFQEPEHQFMTGSVAAELAYGPRMLGREAAIGVLAERLRLTHLLEANPFTLSGGEKRRLSVATVLATDPRLLVLDEPTFGQDALTWVELANLLVEMLDEGAGVVAVTHDPFFARALGAHVLLLGPISHSACLAAYS